jgi:hypothetical protein
MLRKAADRKNIIRKSWDREGIGADGRVYKARMGGGEWMGTKAWERRRGWTRRGGRKVGGVRGEREEVDEKGWAREGGRNEEVG